MSLNRPTVPSFFVLLITMAPVLQIIGNPVRQEGEYAFFYAETAPLPTYGLYGAGGGSKVFEFGVRAPKLSQKSPATFWVMLSEEHQVSQMHSRSSRSREGYL